MAGVRWNHTQHGQVCPWFMPKVHLDFPALFHTASWPFPAKLLVTGFHPCLRLSWLSCFWPWASGAIGSSSRNADLCFVPHWFVPPPGSLSFCSPSAGAAGAGAFRVLLEPDFGVGRQRGRRVGTTAHALFVEIFEIPVSGSELLNCGWFYDGLRKVLISSDSGLSEKS